MKTDRFSEMGIASLLPGMQFMLDEMQERLNNMKQTLLAFQEQRQEGLRQVARDVNQEFGFEPKRRGRPPGLRGISGVKSYWEKMTPEERSAEGLRRYRMRGPKAKRPRRPPKVKPNGQIPAGMVTYADARKGLQISAATLVRYMKKLGIHSDRAPNPNGGTAVSVLTQAELEKIRAEFQPS